MSAYVRHASDEYDTTTGFVCGGIASVAIALEISVEVVSVCLVFYYPSGSGTVIVEENLQWKSRSFLPLMGQRRPPPQESPRLRHQTGLAGFGIETLLAASSEHPAPEVCWLCHEILDALRHLGNPSRFFFNLTQSDFVDSRQRFHDQLKCLLCHQSLSDFLMRRY